MLAEFDYLEVVEATVVVEIAAGMEAFATTVLLAEVMGRLYEVDQNMVAVVHHEAEVLGTVGLYT